MYTVTATNVRSRSTAGGYAQSGEVLSLWDALGLADEDLSWQDFALCKETDPESFFPEKGGSIRAAKGVCGGCEVRGQCLEWAMAHDERFGVWGGLSEPERRRLKKARAADFEPATAVVGS